MKHAFWNSFHETNRDFAVFEIARKWDSVGIGRLRNWMMRFFECKICVCLFQNWTFFQVSIRERFLKAVILESKLVISIRIFVYWLKTGDESVDESNSVSSELIIYYCNFDMFFSYFSTWSYYCCRRGTWFYFLHFFNLEIQKYSVLNKCSQLVLKFRIHLLQTLVSFSYACNHFLVIAFSRLVFCKSYLGRFRRVQRSGQVVLF